MRNSLLFTALLLPAVVFAQVPANDLCIGAEVLTFNNGLASSSVVRNQGLTADAGEAPFSCSTTTKNSAPVSPSRARVFPFGASISSVSAAIRLSSCLAHVEKSATPLSKRIFASRLCRPKAMLGA